MNVKEIVTERIIKELEAGVIPWKKPWTGAYNAVSKKEYKGVNRLLLPSEKYKCPAWLTFNQCRDLGGMVKKGEHGHMVVFYKIGSKMIDEPDENNSGVESAKKVFLLRYYTVFNVEQTSLDAEKYTPINNIGSIEDCDNILESWNNECRIEYIGSRACYYPIDDKIMLPVRTSFKTNYGFYGTAFHEITHSTGHKARLNRDLTGGFGSASYAKEELIAEIGAAMLLQKHGINAEMKNTAAYCQSWLNVLKNDKNLIISAASRSEKAIDLILEKTMVKA